MIPAAPDSRKVSEHDNVLCFEKIADGRGFRSVAGLDEAGRGPLAGPVVAAAVILPFGLFIQGVDDSKRLSADRRFALIKTIQANARSIGIGLSRNQEIDSINILQATRLAMMRAIAKLTTKPDYLLLDAINLPGVNIPQEPIIKGDQKSHSIAAASIVAKVIRDRIMMAYDRIYPQYGWKRNKGYGTPDHLQAIRNFGPSPIHRMTFRGVQNYKDLFVDIDDSRFTGISG